MALASVKARKAREAEAVRTRITRHVKQLLNAQIALATGTSYLYERDDFGGSHLVTDQATIEAYLRGERPAYFFVTTDKPDNRAIDSLMDRAYGKAASSDDTLTRPQVVVLVGQGTVAIGPSPWADPPAEPAQIGGDRISTGTQPRLRPVPSA